jgi:MFS transporter, DHA3 family, tetracycline resistance protein
MVSANVSKPRRQDAIQPSPLRHRNFALLWWGQTASIAGSGVFSVALPIEILRLTGRPLALAAVLGAGMVPMIAVMLVAGALVDRMARRTVMLVSNVVVGISVSVMAVLIAANRARLWEFALMSVVTGLGSSFFKPASMAIVRDVLPTSMLVKGNSLISLSQSLGLYVAGPLLGGLIAATLGTAWAFGIDGVSFAISVVTLAALRGISRTPMLRSTIHAEIRAGVRYSHSQPWLWWSMIAQGISNLFSFSPLLVLTPFLVSHVLRAGAFALGVVYAASGTGGAVAALFIKYRGAPRRRIGATWTAFAGAGGAAVLLGLSGSVWLAALSAGLLWACATYGNTLWTAMVQGEVPRVLLGRVSSVDLLLSLALGPIGIIAGGIAAGAVGVRTTLIVGGAVAACMGSVALVPKVRAPDYAARAAAPDQPPVEAS